MATEYLESEWKRFEEKVVPKYACETQRSNMRDVFYAGAISLFSRVSEAGRGSEDVALTVFTSLEKEMRNYVIGVVAGRSEKPEIAEGTVHE